MHIAVVVVHIKKIEIRLILSTCDITLFLLLLFFFFFFFLDVPFSFILVLFNCLFMTAPVLN